MKKIGIATTIGCVLVGILLLAGTSHAQDDSQTKIDLNSQSIQWFVPGKFEDAMEKSRQQERILLMRGLGFGLDEEGASCATKGCW